MCLEPQYPRNNRRQAQYLVVKAHSEIRQAPAVFLVGAQLLRQLSDQVFSGDRQHSPTHLDRHLERPHQVSINSRLRLVVKLHLEVKQRSEVPKEISSVSRQQPGSLTTASSNSSARNNLEICLEIWLRTLNQLHKPHHKAVDSAEVLSQVGVKLSRIILVFLSIY